MAHLTGKNMTFRIDNAAGTVANISGDVNSASLARAINLLEDSGLGDSERTFLPGLAGTTISLNGWVNTTTDAIFGPLISSNTSITKTADFGQAAARHYTGEVWVGNVQYSGDPDSLQTWSADLTFDGAVTRTSVAIT